MFIQADARLASLSSEAWEMNTLGRIGGGSISVDLFDAPDVPAAVFAAARLGCCLFPTGRVH